MEIGDRLRACGEDDAVAARFHDAGFAHAVEGGARGQGNRIAFEAPHGPGEIVSAKSSTSMKRAATLVPLLGTNCGTSVRARSIVWIIDSAPARARMTKPRAIAFGHFDGFLKTPCDLSRRGAISQFLQQVKRRYSSWHDCALISLLRYWKKRTPAGGR